MCIDIFVHCAALCGLGSMATGLIAAVAFQTFNRHVSNGEPFLKFDADHAELVFTIASVSPVLAINPDFFPSRKVQRELYTSFNGMRFMTVKLMPHVFLFLC
jgi:hypothetical protein